MSLQPIQTTLDFYNNNIKTINAKQNDMLSRYVNITCTAQGKKVEIKADENSAFVRYLKPDGKVVFNSVEILDNGTLLLELTQQMLAVTGKSVLDIIILGDANIEVTMSNSDVDTIYKLIFGEDGTESDNVYDLGVSVLSTMNLYLNVIGVAADISNIESENEYGALLEGVTIMHELSTLEAEVSANEEQRQANEINRQSAEELREQNVASVIANCETATANANTATQNANTATENANNAANLANQATANANTAITDVESATTRANTAAENCENIVSGTNLVMKSDIENNLTTTASGKVLDASQGYALNQTIASLAQKVNELQAIIDALPTVHTGDTDPDVSLGNNGDYYLKMLEKTEV